MSGRIESWDSRNLVSHKVLGSRRAIKIRVVRYLVYRTKIILRVLFRTGRRFNVSSSAIGE